MWSLLRTLVDDEPGSTKTKIMRDLCFAACVQSGSMVLGAERLSSVPGAARHGVSGLQLRTSPCR